MRTHSLLSVAGIALVLSACGTGPTAVDADALVGAWLAPVPEPSGLSSHQFLELGADRRYRWTTETYGPGGRPEDGVLETFTHVGEWAVRGGRLALRTVSGTGWSVETGGYQADYPGEWDTRHSVRLESDELLLTFNPRPEDSSVRRTTAFQRAFQATVR